MLTAGTALVCATVVAALLRWSQWWPHSDMRQLWATGLTALSGVLGLAALLSALYRLERGRRLLLVGVVVLAAVVGLLGGFELLRAATDELR